MGSLLPNKELDGFQKIGAKNLAHNFHHLLGDQPGLGKTLQALAACHFHNFKRVAITCPASVRSGWKQEISECGLDLGRFHIDSYEALTNDKFPAGEYDCVIMDEAHYLKNAESQRSEAMFNNENGLARRAKFKWPMSGTILMNRPRELYCLLHCLFPDKLGTKYDTFDKFANHFCNAFFDGRGINTKGAANLEELGGILRSVMTRRTVEEVLPEMPPVIISRTPLELTEADMKPIYDIEMGIQDREDYLSSRKTDCSQLGDQARLRKATGLAKARAVAEFVEDKIASGCGKVVIFFRHTDVMRILEQELGHRFPVIYAGGMTDKQKDKAKTTFMTDPDCEVFLGQIKAAGTGINGLQKASNTCVFAEIEWSPKEMEQDMDRLRRMGMDMGRPVNAYFLHVPGTIESAIMHSNISKDRVIDRIYGIAPIKIATPAEMAALDFAGVSNYLSTAPVDSKAVESLLSELGDLL